MGSASRCQNQEGTKAPFLPLQTAASSLSLIGSLLPLIMSFIEMGGWETCKYHLSQNWEENRIYFFFLRKKSCFTSFVSFFLKSTMSSQIAFQGEERRLLFIILIWKEKKIDICSISHEQHFDLRANIYSFM